MAISNAMSSRIRPDIFQELVTSHFETNPKHWPTDVKVFEITSPPVGLSSFRSFSVRANGLMGWLTKDVREDKNREDLDSPCCVLCRPQYLRGGGKHLHS
ncbi:hypothetical protein F4824DRAFT_439158 [Ustulina deusta]|nr:hypothetical protein F4824DRAFT_439158 [Ustulina deusta]